MEQRKMEKMKNYNGDQDIGLYYKGSTVDKTNIAPKIETAFNANSSSGGKHLIEEPSKRACYGLIDQDDERIPEGFNWDDYDPNRTSGSKAFVAQIFEDSTAEEELAYAYYESQQYSPKKKEEEPVSKEEVSEKAPIFDHSSDEESDDESEEIRKLEFYKREFSPDRYNLYFAGKMEEIKERQATKKKNHKAATVEEKIKHEENVRVIQKQVKEIPAIKVEKEADTGKIAEKIYPTVEGMEVFEEKKPEVRGCGFLRWADVGEEQGCPICREVMHALFQSIKDKDGLAKCKDKLAWYKNGDVFKPKIYEFSSIADKENDIVENEKYIAKDEDVVAAEESDSYVYFEDQDSEILRPYMEQETDYEKIFGDLTKDYDPEVLEHAWDYTYWDEEDDWYFDPYEGEHGSDSDWSCLDDCHWE
ncbi:uncharacterized protein LOC110930130 [Helianthus annuus]|uniref:uncharacterized protein LOC110930130 n=1 Tax=Helianthus annuus TaxID=4232 RepID=UPI000B8F1295|nr:uncharacterized protein LOC110930130 [Helianthus annuus]